MGTTFVNLRWDPPAPFVQRHYLVNYWPKESHFLMCLMFMPNDVSSKGSGGRNFILPLIWDWFPKSHLGNDPSPAKLGWVHQKRCNFGASPSCRVKEKLIQFSKEQVELSLRTSMREPIHPYLGHPTWENHRRYNIPHIRLHLNKGTVLQPKSGFREGAHEFRTKFHQAKIEILEVSSANYPLWHYIFCIFIQTNPFMWGRFSTMLATYSLTEQAILFH